MPLCRWQDCTPRYSSSTTAGTRASPWDRRTQPARRWGNPPRNVEFMVELVGRKSRFGIDALLSAGDNGEAGTFASLIEEFNKEEAGHGRG